MQTCEISNKMPSFRTRVSHSHVIRGVVVCIAANAIETPNWNIRYQNAVAGPRMASRMWSEYAETSCQSCASKFKLKLIARNFKEANVEVDAAIVLMNTFTQKARIPRKKVWPDDSWEWVEHHCCSAESSSVSRKFDGNLIAFMTVLWQGYYCNHGCCASIILN